MITAGISFEAAEDAREILEAHRAPNPRVQARIQEVIDALYAITNDTDAIVLSGREAEAYLSRVKVQIA